MVLSLLADRIHENFFEGEGLLEGHRCHEIAFYFLMKPRGRMKLNSNSYTQGVRKKIVNS